MGHPAARPVGARALLLACVLASVGLAAGCREDGEPRLSNTRESEEALAAAVLAALAVSDQGALQGFLVSREEYEDILWPEMPDGNYTPFDFVWGLNEAGSRKGLRQLVAEFGGVPMELVSIELPPEPERYPSFTLHQGVRVVVRRTDSGDEGILPSFDVFVEHESGWKLLNFDET